jgi:hypothetical protein
MKTDAVVGVEEWGIFFRPPGERSRFLSKKEDLGMIAFGDRDQVAAPFERIAQGIERLIEILAPQKLDHVGTDYIARRLGCSTQWVARMAERGDIPKHCIVPRVSGGRFWKFYPDKIDLWLREREES